MCFMNTRLEIGSAKTEAAISGRLLSRGFVVSGEEVRTHGAELPLPTLGNRFVVGPLTHGPPADSEEAGEVGVGGETQGLLDGGLGHIHARQSRPLDPHVVKHSRQASPYRSSPMDTMGGRLRRAMALRKVSVPDLVEANVMSRANVYLILNGTTHPDMIREDTVSKLCKFLRINREWLLHGKGPIEGPAENNGDEGWMDVLGYAQAVGLGKGAEAQEYAETHSLKFRAASLARKRLKPAGLAVMYGQGDSMEPRIRQGDAILFDTTDTRPIDGACYVVQWKGEVYVKRAEIIEDSVFFRADNPAGDHNWRKPKRMDAKRDPVQILGRVRWIGSWED